MLVFTIFLSLVITARASNNEGRIHKPNFIPAGEHDPHKDHEMFLGSQKTAEEFDKLSSEESKDRLLELAKQMDMDSDGVISKAELSKWVVQSIERLQHEKAEDNFEKQDADRNGYVEFKEYKKVAYKDQEKMIDSSTELRRSLREDRIYFNTADRNHDGHLSLKEYYSFFFPVSDPEVMDLAVTKVFKKECDTNKNGIITFKEFMDANKDDNGKWKEEYKEVFQKLDANRDKKLNEEEIRESAVKTISSEVNDLMDHLLSESDDDEDGNLSMKEIKKNYDVFVGSGITGFGKHLQGIDDEL